MAKVTGPSFNRCTRPLRRRAYSAAAQARSQSATIAATKHQPLHGSPSRRVTAAVADWRALDQAGRDAYAADAARYRLTTYQAFMRLALASAGCAGQQHLGRWRINMGCWRIHTWDL